MADRRTRALLVRLRQADERAGISRVDAARRALEEKEQQLRSESARADAAAKRVQHARAGGDTAGRAALREKLRAGLREDHDLRETARRNAAREAAQAAREYEASQDSLARAHRARAAAEKALRAAEAADRKKRERRTERAVEDRHARPRK